MSQALRPRRREGQARILCSHAEVCVSGDRVFRRDDELNLFRVTMMRPARNKPEVASPSVRKVSNREERDLIRKGTNQHYLVLSMFLEL